MEMTNLTNDRKGYSPEETARALGISSSLTRKLIKNGTIKSIRLGERRIIVPATVLDRLLEEGLAQ